MDRNKSIALLVVLIACGAASLMLLNPRQKPTAPNSKVKVASTQPLVVAPPDATQTVQPEEPSPSVVPPTVKQAASAPPSPVPQPKQKTGSPKTKGQKEPPADPAARAALNYVGVDPEAEAYWIGAINDPGLPPKERQDLIEDLNEDGLSDPKHPSPGDLPVIQNRLLLIEDLAPFAMDQVNFDAFSEAYKDLENLAELAQGGGHPVR